MMGYWWCAPQDRDVCARMGRLGIEINVQGPEEVECDAVGRQRLRFIYSSS